MQHIEIHFFSENHLEDLKYNLSEEQLDFVRAPHFALKRAAEKKGEEFSLTILLNKKPIGFLALDFSKDKLILSENKNAAMLRSLSINPEFQGKGIAKTAMLKIDDFVKTHFPQCDELVLSVNKRNEAAYQLYAKSGFLYVGKDVLLDEMEFILTKKL